MFWKSKKDTLPEAEAAAAAKVDAAAEAYAIAYDEAWDAVAEENHDQALTWPANRPEHHDFLLAEYNRLCSEIDCYIKENASCGSFSILASGAFWSWIATSSLWRSYSFIIWAAPALAVLWLLRSLALQSAMAKIGAYLRTTEAYYYRGAHGWERAVKQKPFWHLGAWGNLFFAILIAGNLVVAVKLHRHSSSKEEKAKAVRKEVVELAVDRVIKVLKIAPKTGG